jgi:hypothetical protein
MITCINNQLNIFIEQSNFKCSSANVWDYHGSPRAKMLFLQQGNGNSSEVSQED